MAHIPRLFCLKAMIEIQQNRGFWPPVAVSLGSRQRCKRRLCPHCLFTVRAVTYIVTEMRTRPATGLFGGRIDA